MSLDGAVVVVTGAAGAAGPAVVSALAAAGATVVAVGRDAARLAEVADAVPGRVETATADLLDEAAATEWAADLLQRFDRVDGLVHLVGGWRGGKGIVESDLGDYEWLHAHLVRTLQHATRALHDPIAASPTGRVVLVSTTLLERPTAGNAAYLTAKAAAETWARALAHSYRDTEAAVVILRIKALLTPAMRAAEPTKKFAGFTPVDELGTAVLRLFEDPAQEINGEVIDVLPA